jgi:hypothetical protein
MARPSFKPTPALRHRVTVAAGAHIPHQCIALGLGISRGCLESHFSDELRVGSCMRRIEVVEAMFRSAKAGKVAAMKGYLRVRASETPRR